MPTLQMRYKRLKEKMRVWEIDDVGYLKEAREVVVKEFWELVSKKMVELGCKKKIPGVACERKWREIDTTGGVSGSDGKNGSQQITSPKMMQEEIGSPLSMAVRSRSPKSEHKGMMCMAGTPGSMVDVKRERELGTLSEGEEE